MVTEAGSYLRLTDSCITHFKAQGPSRTCNESKEEEEGGNLEKALERLDGVLHLLVLVQGTWISLTGCRVQGSASQGVGYRDQTSLVSLICVPYTSDPCTLHPGDGVLHLLVLLTQSR